MRNLKHSVIGVLVVLILGLPPGAAFAQQAAGGGGGGGGSSAGLRNSAGLQFGQVWPAGKIGEGVDGSTAPGLFYEYSASNVFGLQVNAIRSSHNDKVKIFSTTAGIRANLTYFDKLVPYAFGGVGLYFVNRKIITAPATTSNTSAGTTNFGVNLGLGADLDLGDTVFVGLWIGLHNLFTAKATMPTGNQEENSGRWSAFFIRAGMRF